MRAVPFLWGVFAAVNAVSFALYGIDKRRAKKGDGHGFIEAKVSL